MCEAGNLLGIGDERAGAGEREGGKEEEPEDESAAWLKKIG